MGLWYPKDSSFELTAFSDTDHTGCIDSRKSTSRGIQFLGDKLASWMSKKQNCTAMSSAEAKYIALSASYAQVMWMRTQLQDYGFNYNKIPLYCDSQSAIAISCNPEQHSRTKHIHTRNLFPPLDNPELTIRRRSRTDPTLLNAFEMAAEGNGDLPVLDLRTMEELCQPSLNGRGGPIAPIAIQATNFELKNDMIQQVQNSFQFHGGTFMKRCPKEFYDLIKNMTAHHKDWDTLTQQSESSSSITSFFDTKIAALKAEMAEINKNLMRVLQVNQQVKAVTPNCETYGGPHSFNDCLATVGQTQNVYAAGAYQGNSYQPQGNRNLLSYRSDNYLGPPVHEDEYRFIFGFGNSPRNTITNPKEEMKGVTTRSGTTYQGPTIPITSSSLPPLVKPNQRPSIPYPSRLHDQKLRDKANDQKEKFFQIFKDLYFNISFADALILMPKFGPTIKTLLTNKDKLSELARTLLNEHCSAVLLKKRTDFRVGKEAITFNLDQTSRYLTNYNDMTANRIDIIDMACEEYSQEVFCFSDVITSSNPTPYYDPIVSTSSLTLTPFGDSDFLLEEVDAFLALEDDPTSPEVDQSYVDIEGDILLLEAFLNDDPSLPPPNQGNHLPEVKLKDLPPHLEYAFLEDDNKLAVIIAKDLSVEEKTALITDDFEPAVQHQRRVNPKIHDVIKNEVLKLHDAGLIYPISDSPWVSPIHYVPKKGGFTVVENEENELILTRLVTGWHVCIDYQKLNEATRKDHFPLPFIDQMLERIAGNEYYCFLDEHLPSVACLLGYAMHRARFKEKMLKRCKDTNLCLNWEKSHFMVKEGIVLGHKIFKNRVEVDKAKVKVIAKLPHPTTIKGSGLLRLSPDTRDRLDFLKEDLVYRNLRKSLSLCLSFLDS
uniref:Reverse transcriptase domain-containing protein n=1 Tax=Tanacetum cinerariifolium TaxID=118510 RepID=A0A6L2L431_TANCI|nr:reverse transcriptase domain-containing protein [Tanacetum cinerariifolium]